MAVAVQPELLYTAAVPYLALVLPCLLPSGCGKTGLWSQFRAAGFDALDEAFLDMPPCPFPLHPQSLLLETSWVVTVRAWVCSVFVAADMCFVYVIVNVYLVR